MYDFNSQLTPYTLQKNFMFDTEQIDASGEYIGITDYTNFIMEEYQEYLKAKTEQDVIEQVDALCDLIVVLIGYGIQIGIEFFNVKRPLKHDISFAESGGHLIQTMKFNKENAEIHINKIIGGCLFEMKALSYKPYKCLLRVFKNNYERRVIADNKQKLDKSGKAMKYDIKPCFDNCKILKN